MKNSSNGEDPDSRYTVWPLFICPSLSFVPPCPLYLSLSFSFIYVSYLPHGVSRCGSFPLSVTHRLLRSLPMPFVTLCAPLSLSFSVVYICQKLDFFASPPLFPKNIFPPSTVKISPFSPFFLSLPPIYAFFLSISSYFFPQSTYTSYLRNIYTLGLSLSMLLIKSLLL